MQNTNAENSEQKYDMKLMMGMMDVVDALKAQQKEVEKQLNFEEQKEDIKKRLKATYEAMGTVVTDDQVETAITNYFSNLYTFKEPKKDLNYKLAELYIDRKRITRKYGIPTGIIAGGLLGVFVGIKTIDTLNQSHIESEIKSKRISLESTIKEIRNSNPPSLLLNEAEIIYTNGIDSLEKRLLDKGRESEIKLTRINANVKNFLQLSPEANKLYISIKAIAKEKVALEKGESLYEEAKEYMNTVNIQQLELTVARMTELTHRLNEEYNLFIIGGKKRYPLNNPSHYNYYLIVQAKNKDGSILSMKIKNEETGQIDAVDKWGERVPEPIYRMVESDKKDNGIIDNNVFGKKEIGYTTERTLFTDKNNNPLKRIGQITRWKQD